MLVGSVCCTSIMCQVAMCNFSFTIYIYIRGGGGGGGGGGGIECDFISFLKTISTHPSPTLSAPFHPTFSTQFPPITVSTISTPPSQHHFHQSQPHPLNTISTHTSHLNTISTHTILAHLSPTLSTPFHSAPTQFLPISAPLSQHNFHPHHSRLSWVQLLGPRAPHFSYSGISTTV